MTITINKPTVNGSNNTWGTTINSALDTISDVLNGNTAFAPNLDANNFQVGGTAVTASGTELSLLDGSLAKTVVNSKAVIYGSAGEVVATTLEATTVQFADDGWTMTQNAANELVLSFNGSTVVKFTSTGAMVAEGDVTAFGTVA